MKASDIINEALEDLTIKAIGEAANGDVVSRCLTKLNTMLDAWNIESFNLFTTVETVVSIPAGSISRTIGPGAQINVTRPMRIEDGGFFRLSGVDRGFDVYSREQYAAIGYKTAAASYPSAIYYTGDSPTGVLYFYPVPASTIELHLPLLSQFTQFADLTTDYSFPAGYRRAFVYGLMQEIAPGFERELSPTQMKNAAAAIKALKRSNFNVPLLSVGGGQSRFNILSNNTSEVSS